MEKPKTKPNQPPPPQKKIKDQNPQTCKPFASTKGSAVKALLPKHGAWNPGRGGWLRAHWGRGTLNQGCFCSMKTTFAPWSVISLSKCQTLWEHVITGSCCLACFLDSFDFFFSSLGCVQENCHSMLETNSTTNGGAWVWSWSSCESKLAGKQEENYALPRC